MELNTHCVPYWTWPFHLAETWLTFQICHLCGNRWAARVKDCSTTRLLRWQRDQDGLAALPKTKKNQPRRGTTKIIRFFFCFVLRLSYLNVKSLFVHADFLSLTLKVNWFLLNNKKKRSVFKSSVSPACSSPLSRGTVLSGTFVCTWCSDVFLFVIKLAYAPPHQKTEFPVMNHHVSNWNPRNDHISLVFLLKSILRFFFFFFFVI